MPNVIAFTPSWLDSAPGNQIFSRAAPTPGASSYSDGRKKDAKPGPKKTIAKRGTEIFVAVGREIRWADLADLKSASETSHSGSLLIRSTEPESSGNAYKTIKTNVADDIRQLIISPQYNYLAILTTYTVHIAITPDSTHLKTSEDGPIKLKCFTLGPTTHVTSQSPLASVLWHPLGINGSCLVTITQDAIVRLWELSTTDRWSFDRSSLSIDLQKLADGRSIEQDFGASVGVSKGFSPDSFDLEVAAACFGGRGSGGWSSMTLWVAMREGDVYALSPLLPEKWSPPPTLIPSLSLSIIAKAAMLEEDMEASKYSRLLGQQQLAWMADLDNQEPTVVESLYGGPPIEVYTRPLKPGRVPRLQGPFDFELGPDEAQDDLDDMLTDIYVIGSKMDTDELMFGEEDELAFDDIDQGGLSAGVICLLSSSGRITVCLDLDGVEAQWLPSSRSQTKRTDMNLDPPSLVTFQVIETLSGPEVYEEGWPMFSDDVTSRYSFIITHASGVTFVSLTSWVFRLENELRGQADDHDGEAPGVDFRLDLLVDGQNLTRHRLYTEDLPEPGQEVPLAATIAFSDPDLGYFILTANSHAAIAMTLESPDFGPLPRRSISRSPMREIETASPEPLLLAQPRPVYQPPLELSTNSQLPAFLGRLKHSAVSRSVQEPMRLSPANLTVLTEAHKIVAEETHSLSIAVAELFRRCKKLQEDMRAEITKAAEIADRVDAVTGVADESEFGYDVKGGNAGIEERIRNAQARQKHLEKQMGALRRRAMKNAGGGAPLSDKEKSWAEEVEKASDAIMGSESEQNRDSKLPYERLAEVKELYEDLLEQVKLMTAGHGKEDGEDSFVNEELQVPSRIRHQKIKQVEELLEREGALIEGARGRLEKLALG